MSKVMIILILCLSISEASSIRGYVLNERGVALAQAQVTASSVTGIVYTDASGFFEIVKNDNVLTLQQKILSKPEQPISYRFDLLGRVISYKQSLNANNFQIESANKALKKTSTAITLNVQKAGYISYSNSIPDSGDIGSIIMYRSIDAGVLDSIIDSRDQKQYYVKLVGNKYWFWEDLRYNQLTYGEKTYSSPTGKCPEGWRIPVTRDWDDLERMIGFSDVEIAETGWRGINAHYLLVSDSIIRSFEGDTIYYDINTRQGWNQTTFSIPLGTVYPPKLLQYWTLKNDYVSYTKEGFNFDSTKIFRGDTTGDARIRCVQDVAPKLGSFAGVWVGKRRWLDSNIAMANTFYGVTDLVTGDKAYTWSVAVSDLQNRLNGYTPGICPTGWSVPTVTDWQDLSQIFGNNVGKMLKAITGWSSVDSLKGTNEFGFNAEMSNTHFNDGSQYNMYRTEFWTDSSYDATYAYSASLFMINNEIQINTMNKSSGAFVRCIESKRSFK